MVGAEAAPLPASRRVFLLPAPAPFGRVPARLPHGVQRVLTRTLPAARQGRPRPAPRHRRRHRRGARPVRRDLRLRLLEALFREVVGRGAGGERREVDGRGPRHARQRRRRQAHRHRLRRRHQARGRGGQDRRRRRVAEGHGRRLHRLLPGRALCEALARRRHGPHPLHRRAARNFARRPALPARRDLRSGEGRRGREARLRPAHRGRRSEGDGRVGRRRSDRRSGDAADVGSVLQSRQRTGGRCNPARSRRKRGRAPAEGARHSLPCARRSCETRRRARGPAASRQGGAESGGEKRRRRCRTLSADEAIRRLATLPPDARALALTKLSLANPLRF